MDTRRGRAGASAPSNTSTLAPRRAPTVFWQLADPPPNPHTRTPPKPQHGLYQQNIDGPGRRRRVSSANVGAPTAGSREACLGCSPGRRSRRRRLPEKRGAVSVRSRLSCTGSRGASLATAPSLSCRIAWSPTAAHEGYEGSRRRSPPSSPLVSVLKICKNG